MKAALVISTIADTSYNSGVSRGSIRQPGPWELGVPGDSQDLQRRILRARTSSWAPDVHNKEQKKKEQYIWDQKAWTGGPVAIFSL